MAYNSKAIKTDVNAKPIPQYYNAVTDEYEVLQGTGGAARQVLYGPDGNPLSVVDNKLAVRAAEIEMAIANLQTALLGSQSTAAKQDALAGLVGALDSAAVSDPAAAGAVIALLKGLLSRLQTLENKIDSFTTGEETVNTELKGSLVAIPAIQNYGQVLNVGAGTSIDITLQPPADEIWRLLQLYVIIPAPETATSGNNELRLLRGMNNDYAGIRKMVSVEFNKALRLDFGGLTEDEKIYLQTVTFSNAAPLILRYSNKTDAVNTGTAIMYVLKEVTKIVV